MSEPQPVWLQPESTPWDVPVLDVRSTTQAVVATSRDRRMAENAVSYGSETGASFAGAQPPTQRSVEVSGPSWPTDGPLRDGALFGPGSMDEKWALYASGGRILVVRSWTRELVVVAHTEHRGDTIAVTRIDGAFLPQPEPVPWSQQILDFLIRTHVMGLHHPAPLPERVPEEQAGMLAFSLYGNKAHFVVFDLIGPQEAPALLRSHSLLHIAIAQGDDARVRALIADGWPVELLAADGLSTMHWALLPDHGTALLQLLHELGCPVDARSGEGATPLMNAVQSGTDEQLTWLLEHGADANASDARGFTALHRAAELGKLSAVEILVQAGASPSAEAMGHTPLSLAQGRGHAEIVEALGAG